MQLRKRKPANQINCTVDDSEDSCSEPEASSDEEVYLPRQESNAAQRGKRKPASSPVKRPDLLETALQHPEMRKYFDEKSLRALCLTSRKIRELVENAGALAHFRFSKDKESFDAYLESTRSIQRVKSITIYGKLSIPQATQFVLRPPPALQKLVLEKTSSATEAIICGVFPKLKSFRLSDCPMLESYNLLAKVAWPLQELALGSLRVPADELVAILGNFPCLRKLQLQKLRYYDDFPDVSFEGGLQKLEVLEISEIAPFRRPAIDYLTMRLFHENLQLPALRTLVYDIYCSTSLEIDFVHQCILQRSWVKHLHSLNLNLYGPEHRGVDTSTFTVLMPVVQAGPLRSLVLSHCHISKDDWNQVFLPNLTSLDISFTNNVCGVGFFEWFSTANLPMLKEAKIEIKGRRPEQSYSGINNFTEAFPNLRSLSLSWDKYEDVSSVPPKVVQEMFTHFLPQLEEFTLDCCNEPREYDIADMFGVEEEAFNTAIKWPRLRKLALKLGNRYDDSPGYYLAIIDQLVAAARHCPSLDSLEIYVPWNAEEIYSKENYIKIATTLKESQAWPLMKNFNIRNYSNSPFIRKLWPQAKFDTRYSRF